MKDTIKLTELNAYFEKKIDEQSYFLSKTIERLDMRRMSDEAYESIASRIRGKIDLIEEMREEIISIENGEWRIEN